MAGEEEGQDRTEAPTPRRLERAREEGQVALSREAVGFATLLAAALAIGLALPPLGRDALRVMRGVLEHAPALGGAGEGLASFVGEVARAAGLAVLPVFLAAAAAAVLATLAQTGWPRSARGLAPGLSKLNPVAGLKRLFGPDGLAEFVRALLKLGAVGAALWAAADPTTLLHVLSQPAGGLLAQAASTTQHLAVATLLAFAAVAALDLLWTRWRHLRQLRMSRQELREELRESEGDPHFKARRRQIAGQRARRRMLAAVPQAAVVITNPTHYAIAPSYAQGQAGAPRLVAKGVDAMAARIRKAAEQSGVPVVGNPPLARALYRLELDTEIPPEHWQAVAEVLAYVWRLRGRVAAGAQAGGGDGGLR